MLLGVLYVSMKHNLPPALYNVPLAAAIVAGASTLTGCVDGQTQPSANTAPQEVMEAEEVFMTHVAATADTILDSLEDPRARAATYEHLDNPTVSNDAYADVYPYQKGNGEPTSSFTVTLDQTKDTLTIEAGLTKDLPGNMSYSGEYLELMFDVNPKLSDKVQGGDNFGTGEVREILESADTTLVSAGYNLDEPYYGAGAPQMDFYSSEVKVRDDTYEMYVSEGWSDIKSTKITEDNTDRMVEVGEDLESFAKRLQERMRNS